MELKVTTLEGKAAGSVQLSDAIFGLEPRKDIIQRCVNWQLAKRQAGTHKTQGRADVWRTGKKMYKQKGTGGARHGSARVPQFRGGGPQTCSYVVFPRTPVKISQIKSMKLHRLMCCGRPRPSRSRLKPSGCGMKPSWPGWMIWLC